MDLAAAQLEKMKLAYNRLSLIREKDGILVVRVYCKDSTYVLKCFLEEDFCREIENYRILNSLLIPTPKLIATTEQAILMEDIDASKNARLGIAADLEDIGVARQIAQWYRQLHRAGYAYVARHGEGLYDENDVITMQNIKAIKEKTNTSHLSVWSLIERNFTQLQMAINKAKKTLTYNDFYYTNLIVAKDGTWAKMYDYNLLGKGCAYADVRNVCASLSPKARVAFLAEYGECSAEEKALDQVASVLINLHFACQKEQFPSWAEESLLQLKNTYEKQVATLLERASVL